MPDIESAKSIEELASAAQALFAASTATYQEISVRTLQTLAGEKAPDADAATKDAMTWVGTMARDASNLAMVWQRALALASPAAAPPAPAPDKGSSKGTGKGKPT